MYYFRFKFTNFKKTSIIYCTMSAAHLVRFPFSQIFTSPQKSAAGLFADIRGLTRTAKSPRECRGLSRTFEDRLSSRMSVIELSRKVILVKLVLLNDFSNFWLLQHIFQFIDIEISKFYTKLMTGTRILKIGGPRLYGGGLHGRGLYGGTLPT